MCQRLGRGLGGCRFSKVAQGLGSPDIAFGGELEADVIADAPWQAPERPTSKKSFAGLPIRIKDLGVIGCFSMQERLVGLDLHRSRLALAACDASLLQPLLAHVTQLADQEQVQKVGQLPNRDGN